MRTRFTLGHNEVDDTSPREQVDQTSLYLITSLLMKYFNFHTVTNGEVSSVICMNDEIYTAHHLHELQVKTPFQALHRMDY